MAKRRKATADPFFHDLRTEYRMAKESQYSSKLSGVTASGSGADYHYRIEHLWIKMLERARHFYRNDPIVGQAIRRVSSNVVQEGFRLEVDTGDPNVDDELEQRWNDWADDPTACDHEMQLTFPEMEDLALQQVIVDGDTFALPLKSGALQWIEAHRCRTPRNTKRNVVHGVLINEETGRREQYWITKEDVDPNKQVRYVRDIMPYPAFDEDRNPLVFHVHRKNRFSQTRGITTLSAVSDLVGMHDDLQFAKLVQAQVSSMIAILRTRPLNFDEPTNTSSNAMGDQRNETSPAGNTRLIEDLTFGLEIFGAPGEQIEAFSGNVPNPEFFNHARLILALIAINLGLPVAVLLLDPSDTNFSGWRGAMDQARLGFKQLQSWLIRKLHRPVYRWKVRQWMNDDRRVRSLLENVARPYGHKWHPRQFPYIEPVKDVTADTLAVQGLTNSRRRVLAARGHQLKDIDREILEDNAAMIAAAVAKSEELNAAHPNAKIDWRELIVLPTIDSVRMTLQSAMQGTQPVQPTPPQNRLFGNGNGHHN